MVGLSLTGDQVRIDEGLGNEMIRVQHESMTGSSVDFEVYVSFPLVLHKLSSVETERKGRNRRSQRFPPSITL